MNNDNEKDQGYDGGDIDNFYNENRDDNCKHSKYCRDRNKNGDFKCECEHEHEILPGIDLKEQRSITELSKYGKQESFEVNVQDSSTFAVNDYTSVQPNVKLDEDIVNGPLKYTKESPDAR